jgi:hypothetical protein
LAVQTVISQLTHYAPEIRLIELAFSAQLEGRLAHV